MIILGAGLAGLIAARYWSRSAHTVIEAKPDLPKNHGAVLRCRTTEIFEDLGIPYREVKVYKGTVPLGTVTNHVANNYSLKVCGAVEDRSIRNLEPVTRYIPPADLPEKLAKGLHIHFGMPADFATIKKGMEHQVPIVSTLPMPVLMKIMKWRETPKFEHRPIWTINARIVEPRVDVFQTLYYPMPADDQYRATLNGDQLIIECAREPEAPADAIHSVLDDFGIGKATLDWDKSVRLQPFGKMVPIDDDQRLEFIYSMTKEYGIYSLGRFATWRPKLLLDDLPRDISLITNLANMESRRRDYHAALSQVSGNA